MREVQGVKGCRAGWSRVVLAVAVAALAIYDGTAWWQLTTVRSEAAVLRAQVESMRAEGDLESLRRELAKVEQQSTGVPMVLPGAKEVNAVDLVMKVAGDNQVEVVNLVRSEPGESGDDKPTYRLRLRANMEKLVTFLQMLEESGLHQVVIDRVAARRQGNVWDADLEVTSYLRANGQTTTEGH